MRAEFAHEQAQTYLRQRNRFAVLAGVLGLTTLVSLGAAVTRDEQVVLVPITSERITVSSGGIDAPYLELVTRDTALMLLNRAPESLDYWMTNILKLADPAAHGRLKAELVQIVEEQRGSDISQAFVIAEMHVDRRDLGRECQSAITAERSCEGTCRRAATATATCLWTRRRHRRSCPATARSAGNARRTAQPDELQRGDGQGRQAACGRDCASLVARSEPRLPSAQQLRTGNGHRGCRCLDRRCQPERSASRGAPDHRSGPLGDPGRYSDRADLFFDRAQRDEMGPNPQCRTDGGVLRAVPCPVSAVPDAADRTHCIERLPARDIRRIWRSGAQSAGRECG